MPVGVINSQSLAKKQNISFGYKALIPAAAVRPLETLLSENYSAVPGTLKHGIIVQGEDCVQFTREVEEHCKTEIAGLSKEVRWASNMTESEYRENVFRLDAYKQIAEEMEKSEKPKTLSNILDTLSAKSAYLRQYIDVIRKDIIKNINTEIERLKCYANRSEEVADLEAFLA
jgi:hypothetical protein